MDLQLVILFVLFTTRMQNECKNMLWYVFQVCSFAGTPERGSMRGNCPLLFERGGNGCTGALT